MVRTIKFRRHIGFLLATLGRRTEASWTSFLQAHSVNNAEFTALAVLVGGDVRQGNLAIHMGIDIRNVGAIVRKLQARGWVSVQADPVDGRARVITLTRAGLLWWEEFQQELATANANYLRALTKQEVAELERLLNKLNDDFILGS